MPPKRRPTAEETDDALIYDIIGVSSGALGVIILLALLSDEGLPGVGGLVAGWLRWLMGDGAWAVPLALIYAGMLSIVKRAAAWNAYRLPGMVSLFMCILAFSDMFLGETLWDAQRFNSGGGFLGACLAWLLTAAFSRQGAWVILGAASLLSALMVVNLSLSSIYERLRALFSRERIEPTGPPARRPEPKRKPAVEAGLPVAARPDIEDLPPVPPLTGKTLQISLLDEKASEERKTASSAPPVIPADRPAAAATVAVMPSQDQVPESYALPPASLMHAGSRGAVMDDREEIERKASLLEETLESFGIKARVVAAEQGPTITRYELQPAPGERVNRIVSLSNDIALSLAASNIRIEAPIPGKSAVGIEVPNDEVSLVRLRDLVESEVFKSRNGLLSFALGKDIAGAPMVADLARMPHLLIAGSTGTGKSVCINALIISLLYRATPAELKLVMIDPKRVELNVYEGLPHLAMPVIKDAKQAAAALRWVISQMEARYQLFSTQGVRNIDGYNSRNGDKLPYIVVIIDELADLMLVAPMDVENSICRLAQLARATGIHLVVATQRPSVDIITGTIKANISARISFAVSSQIDSRTILDAPGAEKLMGRGDMLYQPVDMPKPIRLQGAFVAEDEIEKVCEYIKGQARPCYIGEIRDGGGEGDGGDMDDGDDDLYHEAVRQVINSGQASISMLQRRLKVGYARAARLVDMMEDRGVVGPFEGSKAREVLVGPEYLDET